MTVDPSIARRRLRAQALLGEPKATPAEVVRHLVAVQSQDYLGATWALAQRSGDPAQAAVDAAFDAGGFIRTHVLRPTWHFVAPEDLRWLLALNGPRRIRGAGHRHRVLGIDGPLAARAISIFERAIADDGPRTRPQLGQALADHGIIADGGMLAHLVMWAEAEARLCSGPRVGALHSYVLVDERVPPAAVPTGDEALALLAHRYVAGHGPVQDVDLAWWAGINLGEARRGLAAASPALRSDVVDGRRFWSVDGSDAVIDDAARAVPSMHLLPNYDELLVALRDRSDGLDPALPPWARTAEEIFSHVIVRDGLVVGRWLRSTGKGPLRLTLEPRVPLRSEDLARLAGAVRRYGAFVGRPVGVIGLD
ncbi:MAG TPA: winged helix DNA-binding domain-containing protein [Candidatus Limnocylindrales bacterium]|nr:winged helix DNA-binding domain-containing protein [Candidatus Limnocylindrales bacterium]